MRRILITGCLTALLMSESARKIEAEGPIPVRILPTLPPFRDGDVVFFSAPGVFWADSASRWSLPEYRHGHVGIAVATAHGLRVVHAKGSPIQANARVVSEPLPVFLAEARSVSVFRPHAQSAAGGVASAALAYSSIGTSFDSEFSLETADRLYCTELVWRALSAGYGRDVLPRQSVVLGRRAILLSDLETLAILELAWQQNL